MITKKGTAWIEIIAGADTGKQIILGKDKQVLGRGEPTDITFADKKISRQHAAIRFQHGFYVLNNLDSGNGTFVNGVRVQETLLSTGDRIQLGDTVLEFNLGESEPPELNQPAETPICTYCDSVIPDDASHCLACGAAVEVEKEETTSQASVEIRSLFEEQPEEVQPEPSFGEDIISTSAPIDQKKKPSRRWLIVLGILISCCCLAGMTFICLMSARSSGFEYGSDVASTPEVALKDKGDTLPTIRSEQYFEGQEAEAFAVDNMYRRDADIVSLLRYAEELGFTSLEDDEILGAGRVTLDNGVVIDMFLGGADLTPENSLLFFQVGPNGDEFDRAVTFFMRLEGDEENPELVLYHREGSVTISGDDLEFSADLNNSQLVSIAPKAGLMSTDQQATCQTTAFDEYKQCVKNRAWSGWGAGCLPSLVAVGAAWAETAAATAASGGTLTAVAVLKSVYPALVASVTTCGPIAYDVVYGCVSVAVDNPPVAEISSPFSKVEGSHREICFNENSGSQKIYQQIYSLNIKWSDDRERFDSKGVQNYQGLWEEISAITVYDCAGNDTTIYPIPDTFDIDDSWEGVACAANETCAFDGVHANCVPNEEQNNSEPAPEPNLEIQTWPYPTDTKSFSGRYTSVFQEKSGKWVCSNKESHWHDVVFTYKLSDDGATVSWVGIFVDGKEKVVSDPLTYKRLDDGTFFRKSESNNVIWDYTLRFHLDKLEISTFHSKEGMFGTCELTLNSIE